jgi:hypothetical protein
MQLQEKLRGCNQLLSVAERRLSTLLQLEEQALVIILVAGQWHLMTRLNAKNVVWKINDSYRLSKYSQVHGKIL